MSPSQEQARLQAEQAARFLGIVVAPEHLDGVAASLQLLARHAALVMAVTLPHTTEPAPVFVP